MTLRNSSKRLDWRRIFWERAVMKQLFRQAILFCAFAGLPLGALAGPEASGKEMKQVAPAPLPECNWTGFYIGLHVGGQFGHAEDVDVDRYQFNARGPDPFNREWGYSQSGVVAGGQIGYNFQWNWLVLGPEIDLGYMNIEGSAVDPDTVEHRGSDTRGHSDSDFYATFRGRIGIALNQWLFYATGGGIAVNWDTSVRDDCNTRPCGFDLIDAHTQDFDWGWTVGGGIERMIACHWSIKAEYLFYQLDTQDFSGVDDRFGDTFRFRAHDQGHIVRGGLNYKF
jgi:outer membrane immunogenic protein